jgi:hypothetical protein
MNEFLLHLILMGSGRNIDKIHPLKLKRGWMQGYLLNMLSLLLDLVIN